MSAYEEGNNYVMESVKMGIISAWIVSAALSVKFKRGIEQFAAISIMLLIFPIFVFGLFDFIETGVLIAITLGAVALLYIGFKLITDFKVTIKQIVSVGGMSFLALILLLGYLSMGRGFGGTDEFYYWGSILKYYYMGGKVPYSGGTIHPGTSLLWEYFAEKTWIGYTESMAIWASSVFIISMLVPLYKYISGRHILLKSMGLSFVILAIPLGIEASALASIMVDALLGVSFGYTLCSVYEYLNSRDYFYLIKVFFGVFYLCSFKRIGLVLAAEVIFFLVLFCFRNGESFIENTRYRLTFITFVIVFPALYYRIWKPGTSYILIIYVVVIFGVVSVLLYNHIPFVQNHVTNITFGCMGCSLLLLLLLHRRVFMDRSLSKVTMINFFSGLSSAENLFEGNYIKLPPLFAIVVFFLFMILVSTYDKGNGKTALGKSTFTIGVITTLAIVGYVLCLVGVYAKFSFDHDSIMFQYLPAFDRYIKCIYYPMVMLGIYAIFDSGEIRIKNNLISPLWIIMVGMLFLTDMPSIGRYLLDYQSEPRFYGFSSAGITLKDTDRIFLVYEVRGSEDTDYAYAFDYEMYPVECNSHNSFHYDSINETGVYMEPEMFIQTLVDGEYDYVYMQSVDENFAELYGDVVEDAANIKSGDIYVLEDDVSSTRLVRYKN